MLLPQKLTLRFLIGIVIFCTLYRLWPLAAGRQSLSEAFVTEDGYLMLTIARNLAIGLGMSVSDGTIASNGVQPAATFLFSIPYFLTGGDKLIGLIGMHLISASVSLVAFLGVKSLAARLLDFHSSDPIWPWMVAAMWFSGPLILLHTMNGLETGLYIASIAWTLVFFDIVLRRGAEATFVDRALLGVACGLTFLARNDAVFLITSIFLVWAGYSLFVLNQKFQKVMISLLTPGLLSILIATPWLVNNYLNFGSIVPVSGTAQALSGGFAKNAELLPVIFFENTFPMLPVPQGLQDVFVIKFLSAVISLTIIVVFMYSIWRSGGVSRFTALAYLFFGTALVAYYGFYFGAGWFLSRYLAPVSPITIVALVLTMIRFSAFIKPKNSSEVAYTVGCLALGLSFVLLLLNATLRPRDQGHTQVVQWVAENVPDEVWVGAVQTGTLGYWHDKTINLDGKVNPQALSAIVNQGDVLDYVLSSDIVYLADWYGIADWSNVDFHGNREFSDSFELIVADVDLNLGVLRRRK